MFNKAYGYILKHPATKRGYWGVWYYRQRYEQVLMRLSRVCQKEGRIMLLELGCASGIYARYLREKGFECYYVGCDIERKSLKLAYRGKDIAYVLCDIHQLPFIPKCANVILCSEVLEHVSDPYNTVARLSELVAKTLIITFPEERLLSLLRDRHPEHVSPIDKQNLINALMSKKLKIVFSSQIFSSFVPCGLLEFLGISRNGLSQAVVYSIDKLLMKIVPSSLTPHETIIIEAVRPHIDYAISTPATTTLFSG